MAIAVDSPSALTLAVCLVVFALSIPLALWLMSPAGMAGRAGDFVPRSRLDSEAFATVNAIRLADDPGPHPRLVVFGSSTIAQAVGDEERLARAIRAETGQTWDVSVLTTPLQSPLDQFTLIETIVAGRTANDPPLVIAIGMSPLRMNWTPERLVKYQATPRLGVRSVWADDEMRRLGAEVRPIRGVYWLDNARFVILNGTEALSRFAIQRPAARVIDTYSPGAKPLPLEKRHRPTMLKTFRSTGSNAEPFFALHQRLVEHVAKAPNVRLVFIEEALSPDFIRSGGIDEEWSARDRKIEDFVVRSGTAYWPIITEARLTESDFYDDLHVLRGAPQDKVRRTLAHSFAGYLGHNGEPKDGG